MGFPSLILLGIAMAIVSASGIGYVVMKNKQITAKTKIDEVQKRIVAHQAVIEEHKFYILKSLVGGELRPELEAQGSRLIDIPPGMIETYREPGNQPLTDGAVAQH